MGIKFGVELVYVQYYIHDETDDILEIETLVSDIIIMSDDECKVDDVYADVWTEAERIITNV